MFSLRNKELQKLLLFTTIIIVLFAIIGFLDGVYSGLLILIEGALLCLVFFFFTAFRYKQICNLSTYLRRISKGEHSLDIRDNQEGELSILKNEIYKVTAMLAEYNENLKKDKLLLADHMANISHQLKTPLTSMMVMVDLLRDENLPKEKRKQFTTKIYIQLERIEWLVSSLLKMSKLDAGVVEMNPAKIPARRLIQSALEPLLIPLEVKEIDYEIKGEEEAILCDLHWTREALVNILKNCMEHTQPGGKIVMIIRNNPLYSEIQIRDTGKGILKEDLPHIFTRFYRGKGSSPDSVGIGLSMSRSIIRSQGGDITVESKLGEGSLFTIRLYKTVV